MLFATSKHNVQYLLGGHPLSLDSGGNYQGYIGDLARFGFAGVPDGELEDLLAEFEATQQAAFKPIRAENYKLRKLR